LASPYFDHDAFTHHALHLLDANGNSYSLTKCLPISLPPLDAHALNVMLSAATDSFKSRKPCCRVR